jgi:hypothetical protein
MSLISRFEDIHAWQEARKLVKMIYVLTHLGQFAKDFGLRDQIQRASVSTMKISQKDLIVNQRLSLPGFWELRDDPLWKCNRYFTLPSILDISTNLCFKNITIRRKKQRR